MLKFKIIQELKPNTEIIEIIKDYTYETKNGKVKHLTNTNLQFIELTEYLITYPTTLTILEYKVNEIDKNYNKTFEDIKHIDENGIEYWYARELQLVLEYKQWRRFEQVINKAKEACKNSDIDVFEHFAGVGKLSKRANNAEVTINDYKLTRYACYLIAQNGDTRKKVIALAQTYFAIQTRKQEISEKEYSMLTEDEKRFYQTEQKLRKDNIQTEKEATNAHYEVGTKVRKAIADIGGTMPEDLPTPKKSLKQLEKENKNSLKK